MSGFPVIKSLVSPEALGQTLAATYGLSGVRCQLLTASMRDVYRVDSDTGRYTLFLYHAGRRTVEEIRAEWELIAFLNAESVPVAPAVRQSDGELLLTMAAPEGVRYGVLSAFVEGEVFRRRHSPEAARRYGHAIARVHGLTDEWPCPLLRSPVDFAAIVERPAAAFARVYPDRSKDITLLNQAVDLLRPRMEALPREALDYGLIHGDVIRTNAQVADDGQVTLLDFDLSGPGWRAYDIATFLGSLERMAEQEALASAFLEGYQQIREITDAVRQALPLWAAARAVFDVGNPALLADTWGIGHLSEADLVTAFATIAHKIEQI